MSFLLRKNMQSLFICLQYNLGAYFASSYPPLASIAISIGNLNMKLICTSEIFFKNLLSANIFQIEREKPYGYLLIM